MTAHVHGPVAVHDDVDWLEDVVRRLTDLHEAGRPTPWGARTTLPRSSSVASCARSWVCPGPHRADRHEVQAQPESARGDIDGVINGLHSVGDTRGAEAVAAHRP